MPTLRYLNWSAPDSNPAVNRRTAGPSNPRRGVEKAAAPVQVMAIHARVHGVRLTTVLESVVERGYQDVGFDTLGEGPVNIDWTGSADDLTVTSSLVMSVPPSIAAGKLPVSGFVDAKYFQRSGKVQINQLEAHSEGTSLNVTGSLGVYPIDEPSNLSVHLVNNNLAEFDRVLKTLDLGLNGKKGVGGIPVQLHGEATFDGSATGSIVDPAFQGHLTANHFSTVFNLPTAAGIAEPQPSIGPAALPAAEPAPGQTAAKPTMLPWDRLDAIASYSSSLIAVERATLTRGTTVIHASGQLQAHRINRHRQEFDDDAAVNATAQVQNASLSDLLATAGQDLPVTGTLNLQAHAAGTLGDLTGGGSLTVQGGAVDGQPYHSLDATVSLAGQDVNLTKLTFLVDGGTIVGNGTYNLKSGTFLGNLDGTNFDLAHLPQSKDPRLSVAGALKFDAHASGTVDKPSILAGVHLRNLVLGGQPAGALEMIAHTQGSTAYFTAQNSLAGAQLQIKGQTALHGNFDTQAKLVLTNLNIAPFLRAFQVQSVSGNSSIGGTVNVAGPLREPKQFSGDAEINQFSVVLQGIALAGRGTHAGVAPQRNPSSHPGSYHRSRYESLGYGYRRADGQPGVGGDRQRRCQHEAGADLRSRHYLLRPPRFQRRGQRNPHSTVPSPDGSV